MRQNYHLCLLFSLLAVSTAEPATYTLGDLNQYSGSAASSPTLSGAAIAYSGAAALENGIDVFISPDLQKKIDDAMDSNCQEVNNKCYQSVRDLLIDPNTELQARQEPATLAIGSVVMGIVAIVMAFFDREKQAMPVPIHIPPAQISQASAAASATVIVVATGTDAPTITITPKPEPTTVTDAQTPAITTFTSAVDGHTQGDVVITLPEELARRMDDLILRSTECPAAAEFNKKLQKRMVDLGAVVCGTEGLIVNALPGAAFADFRLIRPRLFPWTDMDVVRAMSAAMRYARGYAAALQLDPETAGAFGPAAFAVVWKRHIDNKPLTTENVIPASALMGTNPATTSACSMTSADECFVDCRVLYPIERCGTTCMEKTSCGATAILTTTTTVAYTVVAETTAAETTAPAPKADCNMDDASGFPFNVFQGVYGQFCAEQEKTSSELAWTVDSRGNKVPPQRRGLHKRIPPPNPDTYSGYNIDLTWTPANNAGASCDKGCSDAYGFLANSPCGHTGGQQNIMAREAKLDVGCGTYSYKIEAPPKAELGPQECHPSDAFGDHKDINGDAQKKYIDVICGGAESRDLKAGDGPIVYQKKNKDAPYYYEIRWIDGCKASKMSQNVGQPLGGKDTTCRSLLRENWEKCNNKGVGGWRDAGCLRYEFKAQLSSFPMPCIEFDCDPA